MPWSIKKQDEKYCVVKDSDGSVEKCHGTEEEAEAHLTALNIAESERAKEDAPNYRQSESDTERCSTCRFASDGFCERFDFDFTPSFVCDAWESMPVETEEEKSEEERKLMDTLRQLWDEFSRAITESILGKTSEEEERSVAVGQVYDSLWDALMERDFAFVHDIFVDSGNQMFAVISERGKLFKVPINIADDQVSFGTEEEVVMDFRPTGRTSVIRQADGRHRWVSISATSVLNRVGEIDSTELFDSFIEYAERTGEYPYRTFYHQGEALKTGQADYLARDGNVYITSGLYDEDNDLAQAEIEALEREPDYWGESIRYMPTSPPELVDIAGVSIPVYREGFQIETSILPEHRAAAWFTAISNQEVTRMREEIKEELLKLYGGDEERLNAFISQVDETNREIEAESLIARSADETDESDEVEEEEVEEEAESTEEEETEESEEETEELEIELGDEFVQQVADQVSHSINKEMETLRAIIIEFSEKVDGLDKKVSAQFIKAEERLRELEKSEDEKQAEWLQDLPSKQRTRIKVTHRARMPEAESVPESMADVAEETLSRMPKR